MSVMVWLDPGSKEEVHEQNGIRARNGRVARGNSYEAGPALSEQCLWRGN